MTAAMFTGDAVLDRIPTLDAVLDAHAAELGDDAEGYRNHAYRVANLCVAHSTAAAAQIEKIAVAAAFHDLGIWTDRTFDYLEPSVRLATDYLSATGRVEWTGEVTAMILEHHKVSSVHGDAGRLVESFRRADWTDVSKGIIRFGLPRPRVRAILSAFPNAGFHRRLVQLQVQRLRTHPWHPVPMIKL